MSFTLQQKKEAYEKLSPSEQAFVMDNDTTEIISGYLKKYGLDNSMSDLADTEVLNAMYGLQTLDVALENIVKITGKSPEDLAVLKSKLEDNIFSKIKSITSAGSKTDINTAKKRVAEIVGKYGLSTSQATVLENEVMSVIDRDKNEKITALDLVNLLNISNLLSEQIVFELESRVFERGVKVGEKPEPSRYIVSETKQTPVQPDNFSGALNIPKEMMKPAMQNDALDKQRPSDGMAIGVPRYATEDIYKTTAPATNSAPAPANMISNKLNSVTPTIKPIETQYQKDPYREPLE